MLKFFPRPGRRVWSKYWMEAFASARDVLWGDDPSVDAQTIWYPRGRVSSRPWGLRRFR